ncbi:hypothetical protein Cob_v011598 [Colletotrichum orbiculare MAFF 240422]|uniref:Uncharacterized protein n=2 Tax=Colletotrichum orbiculare species complex TaxID=2707354 RepID=N4UPS9_COLOR|nr:hypothetical protein Cob_v011598 [Colletotrichum orbiculare MAFF 240422]TDZ75180.1 hypothetical protein CTRI78_v000132 [Colletotrichum trifolii]
MAAAMMEHQRFFPSRTDPLGYDDFETASIRSAAPSYFSDAPSYHSTVPNPEPIPPYSPPANNSSATARGSTQYPSSLLLDAPVPPPSRSGTSTPQPRSGLPPIPPVAVAAPRLDQFRIPTWSTVHSNPTLNNVARRRMNQSAADPLEQVRRLMSQRLSEEEESRQRARQLEDPYLVGEEAASRARQQRLARESGDDILLQEDHSWTRWLAQMPNPDDRSRTASRVIRQTEQANQRKKRTRRLAGRLW